MAEGTQGDTAPLGSARVLDEGTLAQRWLQLRQGDNQNKACGTVTRFLEHGWLYTCLRIQLDMPWGWAGKGGFQHPAKCCNQLERAKGIGMYSPKSASPADMKGSVMKTREPRRTAEQMNLKTAAIMQSQLISRRARRYMQNMKANRAKPCPTAKHRINDKAFCFRAV